jgi:hypothetical protein
MAIQPPLLVIWQINLNLFEFKFTSGYIGASHWGFASSCGHCFFVGGSYSESYHDLQYELTPPFASLLLLACCPFVNKSFLTNNPKWLTQIYILIQIIR